MGSAIMLQKKHKVQLNKIKSKLLREKPSENWTTQKTLDHVLSDYTKRYRL